MQDSVGSILKTSFFDRAWYFLIFILDFRAEIVSFYDRAYIRIEFYFPIFNPLINNLINVRQFNTCQGFVGSILETSFFDRACCFLIAIDFRVEIVSFFDRAYINSSLLFWLPLVLLFGYYFGYL